MTLEEMLRQVWQQALVEEVTKVELDGRGFPVGHTPRRRLREVNFDYQGHNLRGIEQNPETASRWAEMARKGARIMQFTEVPAGAAQVRGRFFANVADGKVTFYRTTEFATEEAQRKKSPSPRRRRS
jgi:hypothetical protein